MENKEAWIDFLFCLFLGEFGVHKFREKRTSMGILYLCTFGLFGFGWIVDIVRYFIAAIKGERIQGNRRTSYPKHLNQDEPLPIVQSNLILSDGETCHYSGNATFVKTKNVVVGYSGGNSGVSIGKSYRVGSQNVSIKRSNVKERTPGVLSITNKRIVFSGNKGAFDKKIKDLSAITPFKNGLAFQFGQQQYPLETPDQDYVYEILARIINSSQDF